MCEGLALRHTRLITMIFLLSHNIPYIAKFDNKSNVTTYPPTTVRIQKLTKNY